MAGNRLNRREFVRQAAIAATVLGWHQGESIWADQPAPAASPVPRFPALKLRATRLEEMRRFYGRTFGLELPADAARSLTVRFGGTRIEFEEAPRGEEPFYHFAFNISENKFDAAKTWLSRRSRLLGELFFSGWNAHAVYFADPAGNIGEFIAHHRLANRRDGDFDVQDILYTSEIGLVSNQGDRLSEQIGEQFRLRTFGGAMFRGDAHGMFILPSVGRLWLPERRQPATIFAAEVTIAGEGPNEFRPRGLPYVIRRHSQPASPENRPG